MSDPATTVDAFAPPTVIVIQLCEVDTVLAEFGGDARAAIAALLADLATLARDYEMAVS